MDFNLLFGDFKPMWEHVSLRNTETVEKYDLAAKVRNHVTLVAFRRLIVLSGGGDYHGKNDKTF